MFIPRSFEVPSAMESSRKVAISKTSPLKLAPAKKLKVVTLERKAQNPALASKASESAFVADDVAEFSALLAPTTTVPNLEDFTLPTCERSSLILDLEQCVAEQRARKKRDKLAPRAQHKTNATASSLHTPIVTSSSSVPITAAEGPPPNKGLPVATTSRVVARSTDKPQSTSNTLAAASDARSRPAPSGSNAKASTSSSLKVASKSGVILPTDTKKRQIAKPKPAPAKGKKKKELIPREEFARRIVANPPPPSGTQDLAGKTIYYVTGDLNYASERTQCALKQVCIHKTFSFFFGC